jgi:hypothetical protein
MSKAKKTNLTRNVNNLVFNNEIISQPINSNIILKSTDVKIKIEKESPHYSVGDDSSKLQSDSMKATPNRKVSSLHNKMSILKSIDSENDIKKDSSILILNKFIFDNSITDSSFAISDTKKDMQIHRSNLSSNHKFYGLLSLQKKQIVEKENIYLKK